MKSSLFLLLLLVVSSIYAKPLVDEKDTEVKRDEDVEDASWPRTMEAADMNDSDGYNNVDVNDADMDQDTAMDYSALYDAEALKRYYDDERPQAYDTTDTTKVYEPEMWIFAADDKQQHPTIDKPEHMPLNEMPSIVNWYYNKTSKKWIWRETPKWPELNTELDELPSIVNWKFNKTSKLWFYKVPTPVKAIADSSTPYKDMSRVPLNELPSIVNWHFDNDTKRWFYREVPAYPSDGTPLDELPSIVNWHFDKENKLWSYKEPETDMPDNIDDDEDGPHMKKKPAPPHEDDDDDKTPKKPPHEHEEDDDDDDDKTPKKPHHEHEEDDDDDDDKTPKKPHHHHKKKENPVDLSKVPSTEIKRWMEKVMKRGEDKSMLGLASDNTRIIVSQNKQGEIESIEGAFVLIDADDLATAAKWDGKYNNMALDDDDDDDDYNPFTDDFDVDIYLIDKKGNLVKIEFSRKSVPIDKLINNKNSTDIPSAIIDKLIQANKNATEEEVVIVVAETTNSTVSTTTTTTEAMTTTTTEAVTTTEAPNSSTTSTVITVESTEPSTEPEKPPKPPKILPPPVDKLMSSIKNWRWDNEKKEWFYAN